MDVSIGTSGCTFALQWAGGSTSPSFSVSDSTNCQASLASAYYYQGALSFNVNISFVYAVVGQSFPVYEQAVDNATNESSGWWVDPGASITISPGSQGSPQDFDGNKTLDIATSFYVLPGNGDGTFRPPLYFGQMGDFSVRYSPYESSVAMQDVNGDGKPDIIGIGADGQSISILINSSGTNDASTPAYLAGNGDIVLAPGALASIFGEGLSTTTASATVPLPTTIGNTSVELVDYTGKVFEAPLLYVSPTQINFQVPEGMALEGLAIINVMGNSRPKGARSTFIQRWATSLFTLNGKGTGAPVSSAVRVDANGNQTPIATSSCNVEGVCTGLPIPVSSEGQVYLSLYGTGFRHVTEGQCTVGKALVTPTYIGPQSPDALIDQVNIPIPANTPKGPVDIKCRFNVPDVPGGGYNFGNGNTVTIDIQ